MSYTSLAQSAVDWALSKVCLLYTSTISYDWTSGNEYRLVVVYYAKDGGITDTRTKISSTVTAK